MVCVFCAERLRVPAWKACCRLCPRLARCCWCQSLQRPCRIVLPCSQVTSRVACACMLSCRYASQVVALTTLSKDMEERFLSKASFATKPVSCPIHAICAGSLALPREPSCGLSARFRSLQRVCSPASRDSAALPDRPWLVALPSVCQGRCSHRARALPRLVRNCPSIARGVSHAVCSSPLRVSAEPPPDPSSPHSRPVLIRVSFTAMLCVLRNKVRRV